MTFEVKRIVTDRDGNAQSFISEKGTSIERETVLGYEFDNIWGTNDSVPYVREAGANPDSVFDPFFPPPAGTRFMVVHYPPDSTGGSEMDPGSYNAEALAAAEQQQPGGIGGLFDPDEPGLHASDTIDYGFCVDGEIHMRTADGDEVLVTVGTAIIQRGTRHSWHNRSGKNVTIVWTVVGAERR